jgi:hypothetical protein
MYRQGSKAFECRYARYHSFLVGFLAELQILLEHVVSDREDVFVAQVVDS